MPHYKPTDSSIISLHNLRPSQPLLPPFDDRFLRYAGQASIFMNPSQILAWIDSVSSPYLQDWYESCLSLPRNTPLTIKATSNIGMFINATMDECSAQHERAASNGKVVTCPSAAVMWAKICGELGFGAYTAMTACLVARYGIDEGPFAECKDEVGWHFAAALLLATILVDLEVECDGGYFATLFGQAQIAALERRLEGLAVEATNCKDEDSSADIALLEDKLRRLSMDVASGECSGIPAQIAALEQKLREMSMEANRIVGLTVQAP